MLKTGSGLWSRSAAFLRRRIRPIVALVVLIVTIISQGWIPKLLSLFEHVQAVREIFTWAREQAEPVAHAFAPITARVPIWLAEHWFGFGCFLLATYIVVIIGWQWVLDVRAFRRTNAPPAAPRRVITRPPRPSPGKLTIFVTDENEEALDQAMVSILSEENWAPAPEQMLVTREDGAVTFEVAAGRKFKILVAHPAYPGEMREHIDGGLGLLRIVLKPRDDVASIILVRSSGTLPNLPQHRINPHEGGVEGSYAHVNGLSANGVPANPAHFRLNTTVTLSGLNGPVVNVRFLEIKGEVSLVDYWWPSDVGAPKPDDTLRTLRELRTHSRADIRRRTEEVVSRISVLTGEYQDASFRAEQVAPDLDGPLREEATRIRRVFVDDLLDPVQKLAAEYARLGVSDEGLDEILNRTSFIRRIPTIGDIEEIEKRLALLPDKLATLE